MARSIEARDQVIDLGFAIHTMINGRITKRSGVDVETIDELEHGIRRRFKLYGGQAIAQRFIVELLDKPQPIRTRERVDGIEDLSNGHCSPNVAILG
jgi:hypothetical protein